MSKSRPSTPTAADQDDAELYAVLSTKKHPATATAAQQTGLTDEQRAAGQTIVNAWRQYRARKDQQEATRRADLDRLRHAFTQWRAAMNHSPASPASADVTVAFNVEVGSASEDEVLALRMVHSAVLEVQRLLSAETELQQTMATQQQALDAQLEKAIQKLRALTVAGELVEVMNGEEHGVLAALHHGADVVAARAEKHALAHRMVAEGQRSAQEAQEAAVLVYHDLVHAAMEVQLLPRVTNVSVTMYGADRRPGSASAAEEMDRSASPSSFSRRSS